MLRKQHRPRYQAVASPPCQLGCIGPAGRLFTFRPPGLLAQETREPGQVSLDADGGVLKNVESGSAVAICRHPTSSVDKLLHLYPNYLETWRPPIAADSIGNGWITVSTARENSPAAAATLGVFKH